MKLEDVLPAFRNGKSIRRKSWGDIVFKSGLRPTTYLQISGDILADDWEVEKGPIKYSVELWGNEWHPENHITALASTFGRNAEFANNKTPRCPIKYRVTVEEVPEQ